MGSQKSVAAVAATKRSRANRPFKNFVNWKDLASFLINSHNRKTANGRRGHLSPASLDAIIKETGGKILEAFPQSYGPSKNAQEA